MTNNLDPDHAQHFVGPDLGPNCLQKFSADDTRDKELQYLAQAWRNIQNLGLSHKYKDAYCEIGK